MRNNIFQLFQFKSYNMLYLFFLANINLIMNDASKLLEKLLCIVLIAVLLRSTSAYGK